MNNKEYLQQKIARHPPITEEEMQKAWLVYQVVRGVCGEKLINSIVQGTVMCDYTMAEKDMQ